MPQTAQRAEPRRIKELICRVRDNGQPFKAGTGIKFVGDDLEWDDPEHVTALNKLADWIVATTDNSGPTLEEWKRMKL